MPWISELISQIPRLQCSTTYIAYSHVVMQHKNLGKLTAISSITIFVNEVMELLMGSLPVFPMITLELTVVCDHMSDDSKYEICHRM